MDDGASTSTSILPTISAKSSSFSLQRSKCDEIEGEKTPNCQKVINKFFRLYLAFLKLLISFIKIIFLILRKPAFRIMKM